MSARNQFHPAPDLALGQLSPCNREEEVRFYFCHHVLSLVVFGANKPCMVPRKALMLHIETFEQLDIPFPSKITAALVGVTIEEINKAVERAMEEDVRCIKVEHKELYNGGRRESRQPIPREHLLIYLVHPETQEVLHYLWIGTDVPEHQIISTIEALPC